MAVESSPQDHPRYRPPSGGITGTSPVAVAAHSVTDPDRNVADLRARATAVLLRTVVLDHLRAPTKSGCRRCHLRGSVAPNSTTDGLAVPSTVDLGASISRHLGSSVVYNRRVFSAVTCKNTWVAVGSERPREL